MNEDNIIDERTRGAAKPKGTYTEPGDEEVSLFYSLTQKYGLLTSIIGSSWPGQRYLCCCSVNASKSLYPFRL
jgi:hypothetical protein